MKFLLSDSQLSSAVRLLWKSTEMYGIALKLQKLGYAVFQNHLLALGKLLKKECSWCRPSPTGASEILFALSGSEASSFDDSAH